MMNELDIDFVFLREGTSDEGLIDRLSELLVKAGANSAFGTARGYKGSVKECLERVMSEEVLPDVIFVHRDSDQKDSTPRRAEIAKAAENFSHLQVAIIPVVPVQETEAWLLLDESAIRRVVGKPSGRKPLGLPKVANVENTASPKEVLQNALREASDARGRRALTTSDFSRHRATLLRRLDVEGPVTRLPAWQALCSDIAALVSDRSS